MTKWTPPVLGALSVALAAGLAVSLIIGGTADARPREGGPPTQPEPSAPADLSSAAAATEVVTGPPLTYVAVAPCRVADTRKTASGFGSSTVKSFFVAGTVMFVPQGGKSGGCGIPEGATAVTAIFTAVSPSRAGYMRAWAAGGSEPTATLLNYTTVNIGIGATVPIRSGAGNDLNVKNFFGSTHLVIDVTGYYISTSPTVVFNVGTATSIPANGCMYVFAFGVGAAGDAGKLVTGYITDSGGVNPPPSINNLTIFLPGTIFKTSQGGTIGFVEVCNPTSEAKDLPTGWKLIARVT